MRAEQSRAEQRERERERHERWREGEYEDLEDLLEEVRAELGGHKRVRCSNVRVAISILTAPLDRLEESTCGCCLMRREGEERWETGEKWLHKERRARDRKREEGRAAVDNHSEVFEVSCLDESLVDDSKTLFLKSWGHPRESFCLDRCGWEAERERERKRVTERDKDRQRQTDRQRDRETSTWRKSEVRKKEERRRMRRIEDQCIWLQEQSDENSHRGFLYQQQQQEEKGRQERGECLGRWQRWMTLSHILLTLLLLCSHYNQDRRN
jgi:hypothetical protein